DIGTSEYRHAGSRSHAATTDSPQMKAPLVRLRQKFAEVLGHQARRGLCVQGSVDLDDANVEPLGGTDRVLGSQPVTRDPVPLGELRIADVMPEGASTWQRTELVLPELLSGHHDDHASGRGHEWRDEFRTKPPPIGDNRARRHEGAQVILDVLEALHEDFEGLVDGLLDG